MVLEARWIAQEQKDLARLSPAEAAELASLEAFHTADQASRHAELAAKKRAFGDAHARMTSASELLGEESAHRWVTSQPGMENAKLVSRGSGNNSLDLVYVDTDTGQVMVVEAKGGSARNGVTRKIADGTHAQQGSDAYLKDLLLNHEIPRLVERKESMNPSSPEYHALSIQIRSLVEATKENELQYLLVQQRLTDGELGETSTKAFSDAY